MRLESGVNAGWEDVENSRWVIVKRGEISRGSLPPKIQTDKKNSGGEKNKTPAKNPPENSSLLHLQCPMLRCTAAAPR